MVVRNPLADLCTSAIHVLDRALGERVCGAVVSGMAVPGPKAMGDDESLFGLTQRALVHPMLDLMGYGQPEYDLDGPTRCGGTILATMPMNRPLDRAMGEVLSFMRGHGRCRGLATNGFLWVLMEQDDQGSLIVRRVNLRPFYVDVLDQIRFRAEPQEDAEVARRFLEMFGNPHRPFRPSGNHGA